MVQYVRFFLPCPTAVHANPEQERAGEEGEEEEGKEEDIFCRGPHVCSPEPVSLPSVSLWFKPLPPIKKQKTQKHPSPGLLLEGCWAPTGHTGHWVTTSRGQPAAAQHVEGRLADLAEHRDARLRGGLQQVDSVNRRGGGGRYERSKGHRYERSKKLLVAPGTTTIVTRSY